MYLILMMLGVPISGFVVVMGVFYIILTLHDKGFFTEIMKEWKLHFSNDIDSQNKDKVISAKKTN